ncbi:MAG: hypothetical protein ACR2PA_10155 [Hyphomicrobiaceae bacterium]
MSSVEFLQDNLHILAIVVVFCMVQSVFGMGLLIFGTPTLIILDVPFLDCLVHLIPASLTISLLQILPHDTITKLNIDKSVPLLVLAVIAGLTIHLLPFAVIRLDGLIGIVMLCYGLARVFSGVGALASQLVREHQYLIVALMGLLHGVSNMGGAILAIVSSARHSEKTDLRNFVAMNYAVLAGTQLLVLLLVMENKHFGSLLISSAIALFVYLCIGRYVFQSIAAEHFHNLFTGFIFAYSGALLLKFFMPM